MTPEELEENLSKYGKPVSAREHPMHINMLLYGNYKVGKKIAACHVGKKPLLFACDPNWISLLDWQDELGHVEVQECQGLNHFEAFVTGLKLKLPMYEEFDHIIVGPFNALVDLKLDWLQDNYNGPKDDRPKWVPKAGKLDVDASTFSSSGMGDYGVVRDYFRKYVGPLCRLPKHVTFTCHVREPGFMDKVKEIRASLPGKTYDMIARQVSLIGYMEAKSGKRTISFETDRIHDGGSCFRKLHGRLINVEDLPKLYDKYTVERNFDNV